MNALKNRHVPLLFRISCLRTEYTKISTIISILNLGWTLYMEVSIVHHRLIYTLSKLLVEGMLSLASCVNGYFATTSPSPWTFSKILVLKIFNMSLHAEKLQIGISTGEVAGKLNKVCVIVGMTSLRHYFGKTWYVYEQLKLDNKYYLQQIFGFGK